MLYRFCDGLSAVIRFLSWICFAALIVVVALQVLARNVLDLPLIWTGDLAQMLFIWLIFTGAALGLRTGAHYVVDVLPMEKPKVALAVEILSLIAGACVAWILGFHGWQLAQIRASGEIQSLGISQFWTYLPLPVCGVVMAIYLVEMIVKMVRTLAGGQPA